MDHIFEDLRAALRHLQKSLGFDAAVIATLALGIGANAAIFSIVDAVLLRPLPYKNATRLTVVWQTDRAHRGTGAWFDAYREFKEWQQGSRSFEKLSALSWATSGKTLLWKGKATDILALPTSTDFFSMLGVQAQIGRTFTSNDLRNPCTLVLANAFWQEKLGSPSDIVGQSITVDHSNCLVIGVTPKEFSFYPKEANAWSLITPSSEFERQPWNSVTGVFGLLKPGVTREQAVAELTAMENRVLPEAPAALGLLTSSMPVVLNLQDNFTWLAGRNLRAGLWMISGGVALILLMTCLNVSNLLLGRGMERSREMAVRAALGSGRARLMRQMMTESLILAVCGTAVGILLATGLVRWFRYANPVELPPGNVISLDLRVFMFTATIGISSAIVFGLFPAWRASQVDLNSALKNRERGSGGGVSAQRASRTLVVLQIAFSLILFVADGLLATSLWRMGSTPLGYRTDHVLTASINLPKEHYADVDARIRFTGNFEQKVSALPGIAAVAEASSLTPRGDGPLSVQGDSATYSAGGIASQAVSNDFFKSMNIPVAQGRAFDMTDRQDTQQVAIINMALANRYFPRSNPLGHSAKMSRADDPSEPWLTIVGVVANIRTTTVFKEMGYIEQPTVYRPLAQAAPASLTMMVVTRGNPLGRVSEVQDQLRSLDGDLALAGIATVAEKQLATLSQPRFRAYLLGSFAILAFVLAVVGLYGVVAQLVAQRTREFAIRMAVGATRSQILMRVLRETVMLATLGILCGIAGGTIAVHALVAFLYDIRPENPALFALGSFVLLLTACLATLNPAARAAKIEPMKALRTE